MEWWTEREAEGFEGIMSESVELRIRRAQKSSGETRPPVCQPRGNMSKTHFASFLLSGLTCDKSHHSKWEKSSFGVQSH